jgi:hypothetical protein
MAADLELQRSQPTVVPTAQNMACSVALASDICNVQMYLVVSTLRSASAVKACRDSQLAVGSTRGNGTTGATFVSILAPAVISPKLLPIKSSIVSTGNTLPPQITRQLKQVKSVH